jgi:hypothetical protein
MAISQIAQGVFLVSPDKTDYRDSQAYRYAQIFSKATQRQLDLAREQAKFEATAGMSAFEAEMAAYRAQYAALSKRVGDLDKAIERSAGDRLKAATSLREEAVKQTAAEEKELARREEKRAESVAVSKGGRSEAESRSVGVSGGGAGGGAGGASAAKAGQEVINAAKTAVGTGSAAALAADVEVRANLGQIGQSNPAFADATRAATVTEVVQAKQVQYQREGLTPAEAIERAELEAEDELSTANPAFWNAYSAQKAGTLETPGGGGGVRTSESRRTSVQYGSELQAKYPGLSELLPQLPPADQAKILAQLTPDELAGLGANLEAQRGVAASELAGLAKPKLEVPDLITRSREIAAGRFGPTSAAPAFAQRNALDEMLRMTPEQRQSVLSAYQASRPVAAPAATAAPVAAPAAPAAAPTETPTVPVSAAGIFSAPTTELDALAAAPLPGTEGMRAPARPPSLAESFLQSRAPQVYAEEAELPPLRMGRPVEPGGGVPPSIGEKAEGPVPASMRPPLEFESRRIQEYGLLGMDEETARALAQRDSMALAAANDAEFRRPAAAPVVTAPERVAPPAAVVDVPTPMPRGAAPPAALGVKAEGALLPPVAGRAAAPPSGTPTQAALLEARGRGPLQGQTPEMITAGTNILERKAERTAAVGKAAKDLEAAAVAAGKTGVAAPADAWIKQRLDAAKTLADQPDKLKRLRASEAGRLAEQYFQADRSKGFSPFYTARTTIPAQMADKPDLRDRAVEVALAIAIQDAASKNPK